MGYGSSQPPVFFFFLSGSHEWPLILILEVVLWSFGRGFQAFSG